MQRRISKHKEDSAKDREANCVVPQAQHVKPEARQNRTSRDFNVQAVFLVDERQVADFIDDQAFESEVEDRKLHTHQQTITQQEGREWGQHTCCNHKTGPGIVS